LRGEDGLTGAARARQRKLFIKSFLWNLSKIFGEEA
jgi:hypothetical protein